MVEKLNFLAERDVCGECGGTNAQHTLAPCSFNECIGDTEAMLHITCMVSVGSDVFQCDPCIQSGVEVEPTGSDCSDSSLSDDHPDKAVNEYDGIYVGMPYFGGHVMEIYPKHEESTVQFQRGSCFEMQRLSLSRMVEKIVAERRMDKMD